MKAIVTSSQALGYHHQQSLSAHQMEHESSASLSSSPCVDLKEWCNQRVLAKRKDFFVPGVTRPSNMPNCVLVALDYPEGQQQLYQDIFASGKFDVISDAPPPINEVNAAVYKILKLLIITTCVQILVGRRVCVRTALSDIPTHVFVEGQIVEVCNIPIKQFTVQMQNGERRLVKRADLRLLLPPWWDELQEQQTESSSSIVKITQMGSIVKGEPQGQRVILIKEGEALQHNQPTTANVIYSREPVGIIKNSSGIAPKTFVQRYESSAPNIQLQQVVPTLQSHHHPPYVINQQQQQHHSNEYYRTAATSPFPHETPNTSVEQSQQSQHIGVVSASPLNDVDPYRKHSMRFGDEFESDDELRREDISFPMDGEEKYSGSSKRSSMQSRGSTSSLIEHGSLTPRSQPATPR